MHFYKTGTPSVPAEEALTCTHLDLPLAIGNKTTSVVGFIDEETLLISLYNDTESEMGTISLQGGTAGAYQKLQTLRQNQLPSIGNESWIVITEAEEQNAAGDNPARRYRLFDIKQKKLHEPFWTQSKDEHGYPVAGGSYNPLLVIGSTVYFDDYSMKDGKMTATMYGCDIVSGRITETYPECQKPMLFQDQLIGITRNDNGDFRRLISVKDNGASFRMEYDERLMQVEAGRDGLFALTNEGLDEASQLSVCGLQNLTTGQAIITANTVFGGLSVGDRLVGWSNYTSNNAITPALYDIRNQRLIALDKEFQEENKYFWEYTKGNTALIIVKNPERTATEALLVHIR